MLSKARVGVVAGAIASEPPWGRGAFDAAHARRQLRFVVACAAMMASWAASADSCRPTRVEAAKDAVANERLEIELADGRVIRLAGVESPLVRGADPAAMQSAADDLALWTSTPISVSILKDQPDRWGRV